MAGNTTSDRDEAGVYQPAFDWDEIRPQILHSIASGDIIRRACEPFGVEKTTFLKHVLDGGPREREYRSAQKIALESDGDKLRELDEDALDYVTITNKDGGERRVAKVEAKTHGTVTRNIQWRMERLNSAVYGKETKHTHDVSDSLKERLDRIYQSQDDKQLEDKSAIDAEYHVVESDSA